MTKCFLHCGESQFPARNLSPLAWSIIISMLPLSPECRVSHLHGDDLIIFSKYPVPGFAKTRLIPSQGPEEAANLSRRLTEHTVNTVRKLEELHSSLRTVFHIASPVNVPLSATERWLRPNAREILLPQIQGSLGDRLISAFRRSFDDGVSRAVVIGTDAPKLTTDIMKKAFNALDESDIVIGPALDGGYYLLGMKQLYSPLFHNIHWSTPSVYTDTVAIAHELQLSVSKLSTLRDIDEPDDLIHLPVSEWNDADDNVGNFGSLPL